MRHFKLTIQARGSLLIGGGRVPDGFHGAHVEGGDGRPLIPATALRGAMRETLEALLRGVDRAACEAGTGREAGRESADDSMTGVCTLDGGGPCAACLLFGGTRDKVDLGARDFSSLVLGDANISEKESRPSWMIRPGVSIGRSHRSAVENGLTLCRTTATGAIFTAEGWLRDERLKKEFEASARATTHIGSGRSRGSARVDMRVEWLDMVETQHKPLPEADLLVRVTLRAPTILGIPIAHDNLRDTRREIPGAALRGAVGFALAHSLEDPDSDQGFATLVNEEQGAHFGFLTPVMDGVLPSGAPAGQLPLTANACKVGGVSHGLYDDLFDRIATALIEDARQANDVQLLAKQCKQCGQPLRSIQSYRKYTGEVPVRVLTRTSIERAPSSCRDGALFTEVFLEPGTVFEGTIRCIPKEGRTVLGKIQSLPLQIGRARGAGRGRVSLELQSAMARPGIMERGECFDRLLKQHLERCHLPLDRIGRLLSLSFLSPLLLNISEADEWAALAAELPEQLRGSVPLVRVRRFVREGGWDQRKGIMHAFQAVSAGAVYVLVLPAGIHWMDIVGELEKIERESIGERRYQGYGEVYVFDPIHLDSSTNIYGRTEPMLEINDAELRKKLVVGAEEVMLETFGNHLISKKNRDGRESKVELDDKWKVGKSQLNQLVSVCGEALCVEEIENYLRYQGSRERAPWGPELVEFTLKKLGERLERSMSDKEKVAAWRHFAVFLARSFTYQDKCSKQTQERSRKEGAS